MNIFVVFHHERCSAGEAPARSPRARKGGDLSSAFGVPSRAVRQVAEKSNRVFEKWGDFSQPGSRATTVRRALAGRPGFVRQNRSKQLNRVQLLHTGQRVRCRMHRPNRSAEVNCRVTPTADRRRRPPDTPPPEPRTLPAATIGEADPLVATPRSGPRRIATCRTGRTLARHRR